MRSKLLHSGYVPGISLIVGEKSAGVAEVDGIILHTAFCFSDTVFLIEDCKIDDGVSMVYLCGHGNLAERTIGGRSMKEIATLLVAAGYRGKQQIYLAACSAKEKYRGKTMVKLLEEELYRCLPRVVSDVTGPSVTLKSHRGSTETWLLDCNWLELDYLRNLQEQFIQEKYVFRVKSSAQLSDYYQGCRDSIRKYKENLILGKIEKLSFGGVKKRFKAGPAKWTTQDNLRR